jgi:hypothetical protein
MSESNQPQTYYRPPNIFGIGALTFAIIAAGIVAIPSAGLFFGIPMWSYSLFS